MIDAYYSPTPNGQKLRLLLEETGIAHQLIPVRLSAGEQHAAAFAAISPNHKIPAIVDHAPNDGGPSQALFESGAILLYLARKSGQLLPTDPRAELAVLQWLFWQVAGLGPMAGQAGYFRVYARMPVPSAIDRYTQELGRLYGVLERQLSNRDWVAGKTYTIADIAIYPWIVPHQAHGQDLRRFPKLLAWFERIADRDATQRAYADVVDVYTGAPTLSEQARQHLYQTY